MFNCLVSTLCFEIFLNKGSFKSSERKHHGLYVCFSRTPAAHLFTPAMKQQEEIINVDIKQVDKNIHAECFRALR